MTDGKNSDDGNMVEIIILHISVVIVNMIFYTIDVKDVQVWGVNSAVINLHRLL